MIKLHHHHTDNAHVKYALNTIEHMARSKYLLHSDTYHETYQAYQQSILIINHNNRHSGLIMLKQLMQQRNQL